MGFDLLGFGSSKDESKTYNTLTEQRDQSLNGLQGSQGVTADRSTVNQITMALDGGAIDALRASAEANQRTAEAAVIGSTLVGTTSVLAGQSTAERALQASTLTAQTALNNSAASTLAANNLAAAIATGAAQLVGESVRQTNETARDASAKIRDTNRDSLAAVGRSSDRVADVAQRAMSATSSATSDALAAAISAGNRATAEIGNAYKTAADSNSGNRSLMLAGIIVAGVVALMVWGQKRG